MDKMAVTNRKPDLAWCTEKSTKSITQDNQILSRYSNLQPPEHESLCFHVAPGFKNYYFERGAGKRCWLNKATVYTHKIHNDYFYSLNLIPTSVPFHTSIQSTV